MSSLARTHAVVAALAGAATGWACARSGEPAPPQTSYPVSPIVLPPVPSATLAVEPDAAPPPAALSDHLGEPPAVDPRSRTVYASGGVDADGGGFRPPTPYAVLVMRAASGAVDSRAPLPAPVRACVARGPALLRVRVAPGVDAGPGVSLVEQEGLDAPAAGCIVDKLRKDRSRWPTADDGAVEFDVIVR